VQAMAWFNITEDKLISVGLGELYRNIVGWHDAPLHLVNLFNRNWFEHLISYVVQVRKPLQMFDSLTHEDRLRKFREMDLLLLEHNRQLIIFRHYQNLSRTLAAAGQVRILREEFEKKRRHKPIRKLIAEAYNAIQSVKPVFMMGPMSVATFLEPGTIQFDVVIFDEASQIRPADAFGSIIRSKQVVVVGDSKQMPPTSFFDSISESNDSDEDTKTSDYESILGLFNSRGVKEYMLRWHYRSQHESLIAVSNHEFYENKLLIIPSPKHQNTDLGLIFHYLPNTYYEPGTLRYNQLEARAVAQAVINHARLHPELTLGVAAFSQAQMQAVRDELEVLRRQNIDYEPFFNRHPNEPFFIKNLENVQGDERDVIFLSIGYGKTKDGRLSMNFGPLNRDGGERRLNVLITRARYRCEVFTNLLADDLDLSKSQARGVAALKRFLKYAETGDLGLALPSLREPGSVFEEAVAEKLKERGYIVHYQVGTAGFFIDLAIVDPENPGTYLIGIECDGAQYHRSASARDRDRLRQVILESKGWVVHRIWSTDWFNNPKRELERTVQAIEESKQKRQHSPQVEPSVVEVKIERQNPAQLPANNKNSERKLQPYQLTCDTFQSGWSNIEDIPAEYLEQVIERVVTVEAPVHIDEVIKRVSKGLGFARTGAKIKETLEFRILRMNSVRKVGEFLVLANMSTIVPRDRALLPPESRKIEYISPDEIAIVVNFLVESSRGISVDELVREICLMFGFSRVTQQMQDYMRKTISKILNHPNFVEKNGTVMLRN
jgi:very-short-patch-repair endonuclease